MEKQTKQDQYIGELKEKPWISSVDTKEKVVGVFSDTEDMIKANSSKALKKMRNLYKYHIQIVIR